jgi:hypothetical protein
MAYVIIVGNMQQRGNWGIILLLYTTMKDRGTPPATCELAKALLQCWIQEKFIDWMTEQNFRLLIKRVWICVAVLLILLWCCGLTRATASSFLMFLDPVQRRTTVGKTPLNKWSAHRWYLYLTTQNTHKRQKSIHPAGFDRTLPVKERPKDHTLDPATTAVGIHLIYCIVVTCGLFKESVSILGKKLGMVECLLNTELGKDVRVDGSARHPIPCRIEEFVYKHWGNMQKRKSLRKTASFRFQIWYRNLNPFSQMSE